MPDLIENGYFDDDDMAPWERCVDNELGEAWICLEDAEPDFDRRHWHFTQDGSITDQNRVFLSAYNLLMQHDDGVVQRLGPDARASGDFSLWVHCTPPDRWSGVLHAFVCYRDKTFNYASLTRDQLRSHVGPNKLRVPVQDKLIEKVVICVVDAEAPWYVDAIELPAAEAKARPFVRPAMYLENRVALLEKQVDHLFHVVASGRPAVHHGPEAGEKELAAKT